MTKKYSTDEEKDVAPRAYAPLALDGPLHSLPIQRTAVVAVPDFPTISIDNNVPLHLLELTMWRGSTTSLLAAAEATATCYNK